VLFTPSYNAYELRGGALRYLNSGRTQCVDSVRICIDSAEKIVGRTKVRRPCMIYSYSKNCSGYPSKKDCGPYRDCYAVSDRECLTRDNYGNCVNIRKEFSCKRHVFDSWDKEKLVPNANDKERARSLVCRGLPCAGGNCFDKSYAQNDEMLDSVSKLYAAGKAAAGRSGANIFPGSAIHCSKKAIGYSNCCFTGKNGLLNNVGLKLGAHCSPDEKLLLQKRRNNLCEYAGKQYKGSMRTIVKHYYCCYDSVFSKVFAREARAQLGFNFGSGGYPNCRGFTLEELARLDFNRMNFSEAFAELLGKVNLPGVNDLDGRVRSALPNIDSRPGGNNAPNRRGGVNSNFRGDLE
jgi:hypothetical protein